MKKSIGSKFLVFVAILAISGCVPASTLVPPTLTRLPLSTKTSFPTETPIPTLTPKKEGTATQQNKNFVIAHSQAEAEKTCKINDAEINDWMEYAKSNDSTGDFSDQVIHWQLGEVSLLGGAAATHVYWYPSETNTNPWLQFADPNKRPTKRVAFCTLDRGSWTEVIRLVKYQNPSGNISWWMIRGTGGSHPKRFDDFPVIEWKIESGLPLNDPEVIRLLREWVSTGGQADFPKELEGHLLFEIN